MNILNKEHFEIVDRPIKVLQFGEGNFLRAFADVFFDELNEKGLFDGSIVIVKPREGGDLQKFRRQDNLYTVSMRGRVSGKAQISNRIVSSVKDTVMAYEEYDKFMGLSHIDTLRYVVSNTTEAGIVFSEEDRFEDCPPKTFPGKLTKFLYERFRFFEGSEDKGLVMLPVELIEDNGIVLKKCVHLYIDSWNLPREFHTWVDKACIFASTLVDRIVTGYPKNEEKLFNELGYEDHLFVACEPFSLWVIEAGKALKDELKFDEAGLPVIFTDNHKPYKQRKVRILNGAHTSFVLASYLCGNNIVRESMEDELIRNFMHATIFDEVIPTLSLPKEDLCEFADEVIDRFNNPYVDHSLLAISLNSVSKWKARCMDSLIEYVNIFKENPTHLTFSLAALMAFYSSSVSDGKNLIGDRKGEKYVISDDEAVLRFFKENCKLETKLFVRAFLSNEAFFSVNLCEVGDTYKMVCRYLDDIKSLGMRAAMEKNF